MKIVNARTIVVGASWRELVFLEHFNDFSDAWVRDLGDAPPTVDPPDGCFAAPERPGLGLRLNHDECATHPRTGGRIRLFEAGWEKRTND